MNFKLFLRYSVPVICIFIFLFICFKFLFILAPFAIGYILYFFLKPFVNLLEQKGINHILSVSLVFICAFGILLSLFIIFIPAIGKEVSNIQNKLDIYINVLSEKITAYKTNTSGFSDRFSVIFKEKNITSEIVNSLKTVLGSFILSIPGKLFNFLPLVLYIGIIPFATFFLLLDDTKIKKKIIDLVPNRYFETTLLLLHSLHHQFGSLLRGMFLSAFIISILASFGLWLIDLEYPILIGIFAGLSNLIPYVGPIVGTFAAFLVAIMTAEPLIIFLYIILVFLAVNLFDNVFVQPIVMSRAANLHPLIVIILVLLGSKLAGIIGMFIAVPLASLVQVVLKILYKEIRRPKKPDFSEYKIIKN